MHDSFLQGELQLNVHQQRYIAKTKEEEMVNAIIDLAKYGEQTNTVGLVQAFHHGYHMFSFLELC